MATENVRVLKIDTNPAQTSVKELRQQLKELKDTMLSCEKGTEEYNNALQQAANIQHDLKEQMEEVNASAMDFGQIVGNSTKAIGGLVGGFQAATAVMNLFGTENEDVIKTLKTMQQLMSITQALPAIDNGIKAFKRLGIAIKASTTALKGFSAASIATGLGAIVAALGLLIANWDKLKIALGGVNEEVEKQKQAKIDNYLKSINDELQKQFNLEKELIRIRGGNDLDVAKAVVDTYTTKISEASTELERLKVIQDELVSQDYLDTYDLKRLSDVSESYKKIEAEIKNYNDELKKATEEYEKQKILQDARDKTAKDAADKELAILLDEFNAMFSPKSLQEELDKKFEGKALKIPVNFEMGEDEDVSAADELRKKIEGIIQGLRDSFVTPEEQYQKEIDALDLALKTKLIKEEEYLKLRDNLQKEQTEREVMRYTTAAYAIGEIFSNLGDVMEEGSKEQKALQIMGATINMLAGITAAIAGAFTTHSGPWDIALAAIQATAIAAGGAATIAKMSKTTEKNATSMASASPSTAAISSIIAPVQYTQDVQGASIEGAIKNSKVYVVESDITNTQNKVNVTESEARY